MTNINRIRIKKITIKIGENNMNLVRFNHPGFTNFFDNFEKIQNGLTNESKGDVPSVNIVENEKDFVIELAAPGVKKDDFNINLDNHDERTRNNNGTK